MIGFITRPQFLRLVFAPLILLPSRKVDDNFWVRDVRHNKTFDLREWSNHLPPESILLIQNPPPHFMNCLIQNLGDRKWSYREIDESTLIFKDGDTALTTLSPSQVGGDWVYIDMNQNNIL